MKTLNILLFGCGALFEHVTASDALRGNDQKEKDEYMERINSLMPRWNAFEEKVRACCAAAPSPAMISRLSKVFLNQNRSFSTFWKPKRTKLATRLQCF